MTEIPNYLQPGDKERLTDLFTYHKPKEDQIPRYQLIRDKTLELAILIHEVVPPCAQRDTAIQQLVMTRMSANAGIACNEGAEPEQEDYGPEFKIIVPTSEERKTY